MYQFCAGVLPELEFDPLPVELESRWEKRGWTWVSNIFFWKNVCHECNLISTYNSQGPLCFCLEFVTLRSPEIHFHWKLPRGHLPSQLTKHLPSTAGWKSAASPAVRSYFHVYFLVWAWRESFQRCCHQEFVITSTCGDDDGSVVPPWMKRWCAKGPPISPSRWMSISFFSCPVKPLQVMVMAGRYCSLWWHSRMNRDCHGFNSFEVKDRQYLFFGVCSHSRGEIVAIVGR